MIQLPDEFREKMKGLLGAEYDSFIESYDKERVQGLRGNSLKISREKFDEICPFQLRKIPWAAERYYYQLGFPSWPGGFLKIIIPKASVGCDSNELHVIR